MQYQVIKSEMAQLDGQAELVKINWFVDVEADSYEEAAFKAAEMDPASWECSHCFETIDYPGDDDPYVAGSLRVMKVRSRGMAGVHKREVATPKNKPWLATYVEEGRVISCPEITLDDVDRIAAMDFGMIYINVLPKGAPGRDDNDLGLMFDHGMFEGFGTTSGLSDPLIQRAFDFMEPLKMTTRDSWRPVIECLLKYMEF